MQLSPIILASGLQLPVDLGKSHRNAIGEKIPLFGKRLVAQTKQKLTELSEFGHPDYGVAAVASA